jgi:hypothetical protein
VGAKSAASGLWEQRDHRHGRFFASAKFTGLEFIELIQRHPTIVFKFERLFKFKWGANVD